MSNFDLLTEEEQATLRRAIQILLSYHREQSGSPCSLVFTAETGWTTPLHACGCDWPRWTLAEMRHA
jgi:hypothetical protein